jgi:D-alanine-D-alanine ligase-like ATP-grasp enzyme
MRLVGNTEGILNAAAPLNKLEAFRILREKEISVPQITTLTGLIVRKFQHHQGRDILTDEDAFLVERLNKTREIRLDTYRQGNRARVFRLHTKTPLNPDSFIWNRNNCEWRTYNAREMVAVLGTRTPINLAKQALLALEYDFGAVDLVRDDAQWYVLEINSAPRLGEVGVRKYAKRINIC